MARATNEFGGPANTDLGAGAFEFNRQARNPDLTPDSAPSNDPANSDPHRLPSNFEGALPGPDVVAQTTEMPTPTIPEPGDDGRNVDLSDSLVVVFVVGAIIWVLSRVFS